MGDVYTVHSAGPIFVTVMGYCFLGETFGVFEIGNIAMVLFGIVLVVRPPFLFGTITTTTEEGSSFSEGDFLAYGLVVLAAVFQSGAIVCTRALKPVDVFVISSWIGSSEH